MSVDFPRAWQISRAVPYIKHHEHCSYRISQGGYICDCNVLVRHPDFLDDVMQTVKERPILFSGPLVNSIRSGNKTQTRRVLKTQPMDVLPMPMNRNEWVALMSRDPGKGALIKCRYGAIGDRLWVREAWTLGDTDGESRAQIYYRSDNSSRLFSITQEQAQKHAEKLEHLEDAGNGKDNWQASIHMPRWASRIMLEIINVRVERVRDITNADIIAEGITAHSAPRKKDQLPFSSSAFAKLFDAAYAKRGIGWDVNPWVWVIEFKEI